MQYMPLCKFYPSQQTTLEMFQLRSTWHNQGHPEQSRGISDGAHWARKKTFLHKQHWRFLPFPPPQKLFCGNPITLAGWNCSCHVERNAV